MATRGDSTCRKYWHGIHVKQPRGPVSAVHASGKNVYRPAMQLCSENAAGQELAINVPLAFLADLGCSRTFLKGLLMSDTGEGPG